MSKQITLFDPHIQHKSRSISHGRRPRKAKNFKRLVRAILACYTPHPESIIQHDSKCIGSNEIEAGDVNILKINDLSDRFAGCVFMKRSNFE